MIDFRLPLTLLATIALAACGRSEDPNPPYGVEWGEEIRAEAESEPEPVASPTPQLDPQVIEARAQLNDRLDAIGEDFGGSMGIAVVDVDARWSTGFNERALLPQQSVSKTWVALTALVMAEEGLLNLDAPIRVGREDLTLFHFTLLTWSSLIRQQANETGEHCQ